MTELLVPTRFRGPASSGNGGWTAGALAALAVADPVGEAAPAVQVTLRGPPPLDTSMPVADGAARDGEDVVAEAVPLERDLEPVDPVPVTEASAAMATYPGLTSHPFPSCFACGTGRGPGDGLRIFPGEVTADPSGRTRVASTWTPDPSLDERGRVPVAVAWAALDCVGGWAGDLTERLMVLGRMTARLTDLPRVGVEHVVVGGARGRDGRKTFTAASLYDGDGRLVGTAEHVWFAVDPAAFS
ncbi:hypothetical protein [Nocardioides coralli]|uniref:hypothetical protein n=1 Tax=Nocardioides coralli TaxID=2872154 RepID=UPI001CA45250|nr:hypothetical protein [Nocardioides coralli]QZY29571.1 hypothetical protein K6T13_02430 [Nocardioides coralli]